MVRVIGQVVQSALQARATNGDVSKGNGVIFPGGSELACDVWQHVKGDLRAAMTACLKRRQKVCQNAGIDVNGRVKQRLCQCAPLPVYLTLVSESRPLPPKRTGRGGPPA